MGLSGSEYHTFSFYKRVEKNIADEILNSCIPIGAKYAKEISMVDEVFDFENYDKELNSFCESILSNEDEYDDFIDRKKDFLFENESLIEELKEKELQKMYDEFWDENSSFHKLRYEFIYKKEHKESFERLKEL